MMVQKEHWKGQPRPQSKEKCEATVRLMCFNRQNRDGCALKPGQFVHVVVDRLQLARKGILQDQAEPAFLGLSSEDCASDVESLLEIRRNLFQHGEAA